MKVVCELKTGIHCVLKSRWLVLVFIALLAPFFAPDGFQRAVASSSGSIILAAKIASLCVAFCGCLIKRRLDAYTATALLVTCIMLLSTVLNEEAGRSWVYSHSLATWTPIAAMALITCLARHNHMTDLLLAILVVTGFLSLCNTASVLIFPRGFDVGGSDAVNFYGNKNTSIEIILPSVLTSLILDKMHSRRFSIRSAILVLAGFIQCATTYSATSVVALFAFLALAALVQLSKVRPLLSGLTFLVGYVVSCILVIFLKIQELFSPVIVTLLGKTPTFTGRTFVWEGVLTLMTPDHLLLGYGTSPQLGLEFNGYHYYHAHNFALQILLCGGMLGMVFYAILVGLASYSLFRNRRDPIAALIAAAVGSMLLVGLMEPLANAAWPLLLALGYYWKRNRQPSEAKSS